MKIGLKTVVAFFIAMISALACAYMYSRRPHLFWDMDPGVGFTIGVFAVVSAFLFSKFWDVHESSKYSLTIIQGLDTNPERIPLWTSSRFSMSLGTSDFNTSFELPSSMLNSLYFITFLALSVILIDNRSLFLAYAFPETLDNDKEYCPKQAEKYQAPKPKPGCELVIKAFEMGFAKELGDCDPRLVDGKVVEPKICKKRRRDEPYPHFAFRLLERFVDKNIDDDPIGNFYKKIRAFREKMKRADLLAFEQVKSLRNLPRSSHHIFTNYPHPDGVVRGAISSVVPLESCQDKVAKAPAQYMGDPKHYAAESKLIEHTFGQLLFSQTHEPGAGYCPEYKIHWGSNISSCDALIADPEKFLSEFGVVSEIEGVLARVDATNDMAKLEKALEKIYSTNQSSSMPAEEEKESALKLALDNIAKNKDAVIANINSSVSKKENLQSQDKSTIQALPKKSKKSKDKLSGEDILSSLIQGKNPAEMTKYVSFHCLITGDDIKSIERKDRKFHFSKIEFDVKEVLIPRIDTSLLVSGKNFRTDYYEQMSQALAPGFTNVGFESQANILDEDIEELAKNLFKDDNKMLFTKLEILGNVDILSGQEWIKSDKDILEIYPWQTHLGNYVKRFRKTYKDKRGRL